MVSISRRIWSIRPFTASALPAPSTMVVSSFVMMTFFAWPIILTSTFSTFTPRSSEMNLPPVRIAISSIMAFRRSPKPGAFAATARSVPRILFTTRVASASPSTSSAMIRKGRRAAATFSSTGMRSAAALIFFSWIRISGSSRTASILSGSVTM